MSSPAPKRKLPTFKAKSIVPVVAQASENEAVDAEPVIVKRVKKAVHLPTPQPEVIVVPRRKTLKRPASLKSRQVAFEEAIESDPATHTEELPDNFYPINRFGFSAATTRAFGAYTLPRSAGANPERCADLLGAKDLKPFAYQKFVRDFMQSASPYRGLLVYHGLGSGKTCTAVGTAEALRVAEPNRHIFIITPASLRTNFRNDLKKCGSTAYSTEHHWIWLQLPASDISTSGETTISETMKFLTETVGLPEKWVKANHGGWYFDPSLESNFSSLGQEKQAQIQNQIEAIIDERYTFISYNGLQRKTINKELCETIMLPPARVGGPARKVWRNKFDGALVIVDEVHNFVRKITSILEQVLREEDIEARNDSLPPACKGEGIFSETGYPIGYVLYHWLTTARNCRVLGLSGTPIINFANEIAILMNMLHGNTEVARFPVRINPSAGQSEGRLRMALAAYPLIDYLAVKLSGTEAGVALVEATRCPDRHIMLRDDDGHLIGLMADTDSEIKNPPMPIATFGAMLRKHLEKAGYELPIPRSTFKTTEAYTLLPAIREDFLERYVAPDYSGLIRTEQLKRRMSGLVSFYRGANLDLMPRTSVPPKLVILPMSDYQASIYAAVRTAEMEKERHVADKRRGKTAKKGSAAQIEDEIASSYKIYSRAACNFVFPEEMERPRPGGRLSEADADLDVPTEDLPLEDETTAIVPAKSRDDMDDKEEYKTRVQEALEQIWKRRDEVLTIAGDPEHGLAKYSAKYAAIIEKLEESPGSALVYSQFKSLEGLRILSMAMDANGYAGLRLKRVGEEWSIDYKDPSTDPAKRKYILYSGDIDEKERELLRKIFNGMWNQLPLSLQRAVKADAEAQRVERGEEAVGEGKNPNLRGQVVRCFMITEAGAEGISLKNVRQVHMMEPYWNMVRLEQVQGRAARLCSHMELPEEERTVDVFIYLVKFSKEQLGKYATLVTNDNKQTTDQNVFDIAQRKLVIANALQRALQEAAVDCSLNAAENGVPCSVREGDPERYMYTPNIKEDDLIDDSNIVRVKAILDKKRGLVLDKVTGKVIGRIVDGRPVLDVAKPAAKEAPVVKPITTEANTEEAPIIVKRKPVAEKAPVIVKRKAKARNLTE